MLSSIAHSKLNGTFYMSYNINRSVIWDQSTFHIVIYPHLTYIFNVLMTELNTLNNEHTHLFAIFISKRGS